MTGRDRRAILLGAVVALSAWLLLRGVPWLHGEWLDIRARVQAERRLLAETRLAIEDLPRMEDSAHILTRRVGALAPRILTGSTGAFALSDLSNRMSSIVGLAHGRVLRFEEVPDSTTAGPLRKVTAQVAFEADFRGVGEVLDYLGRSQPVVVSERLEVTAPDPGALPSVPEQLTVLLQVSAWYLAEEVGG